MDTHYYICNAIALMAYTTSCQPEKQHTHNTHNQKIKKKSSRICLRKKKIHIFALFLREVKNHGNMLRILGAPSMCFHQRWDTYIKRRFLDALVLTS